MTQNILLSALAAGVFVFSAQAIQARASGIDTNAVTAPVVVELFTSQGCSSCPPADKILGEISANKNIIPLSFHVTYWDRLGWPDTLGREFSTSRQQGYGAHKKSRRVYTPQMIVNGGEAFVGSDKRSLSGALNSSNKLQPIEIIKTANNVLSLKLPEIPKDGSLNYMIRLYGVKSINPVEIQRGENRGRVVNYHNAVLYEQPIGAWLGKSENRIVNIPMDKDLNNVDKFVILAQKGGFGEIVAAGQVSK